MRHSPVLLTAIFVWLLTSAPARAEFVAWQYNWTASPAIIHADAPGTGTITLTDQGLKDAAGDTDIVATNLKVVSDAPPNNPDVFTNKPFTLTLFLLDVESSESDTIAFSGLLNGKVSKLSSLIPEPTFTGETTQSRVIGLNLYTVTIGPYTPPGPPGSDNSGAISAQATVTITAIHKTPEPSTLILACTGLPFAGFAVWRRRRTARRPN